VMVAVSMSTALASRLVDRSFFLTQLSKRNIHCAAGPQAYLLTLIRVGGVMRVMGDPRCADARDCAALIDRGLSIHVSTSLETAMPIFDREDVAFLPVVVQGEGGAAPEILGALYHIDSLKAYNRALAAAAAEEHS